MGGADALRRARRARRVDEAEVVPRLDRPRQRRPVGARAVEQLRPRDDRPGQLDGGRLADDDHLLEVRQVEPDEPVDQVRVGDDHLRAGEVQRVLRGSAPRAARLSGE